MGRYSKAFSIKKQFQSPNCQTCQGQSRTLKKIVFLELFLRIIEDEKWNLFEKLGQLRTPTGHPLTSLRHHPPAAAATTTSWLSFGFQRPHRPNFKLFWSAAAAAAGLGCLSRRVCAVKPKDVVNVFGRCRPVKTRRRLRVG